MITVVDDRFRLEAETFRLRCTCEWCAAFDSERAQCAYGFPTDQHRRLPLASEREFSFCKAFELA